MGLFDKIFGFDSSENATLSKEEAFASIMLAVVAADGHISQEEAVGFNAVANRMKLFQGMDREQFGEMIDRIVGFLKKRGVDFLLEKAGKSLSDDLRPTAFAVAADLAFADGSVEEEEKEIMEKIQGILKIPDELAIKIIEVLAIKNRG